MHSKSILITGAGLVGSLLAICMAKRGYSVSVFEKREDPRISLLDDGRSINLALSHRGIRALELAGLETLLLEQAIPMHGRMVHDGKGATKFQQYGESGQYINSISRAALNRALINHAEKVAGVTFSFHQKSVSVDFENKSLEFEHKLSGAKTKVYYEYLAGADGAFSVVRKAMEAINATKATVDKLSHGYKELHLASGPKATHTIEKNALHIWPRGKFMLIALPNLDGSFTSTLFLPFEGENSFEKINSLKDLRSFFNVHFPDALQMLDGMKEEDVSSTASFLATVHVTNWTYNENVFLIGDAAHAIVPFYGQGMNCGFEDVRILMELLDENADNWNTVLPLYQKSRKPSGDAIAELAMQNFVEMRDLVDDEDFLFRKKIEAEVHKRNPTYLPLYSMVTFSDIPYEMAKDIGDRQSLAMSEVLRLPGIREKWLEAEEWNKVIEILEKHQVL